MKKFFKYLSIMLLACGMVMTACSKDDSDSSSSNNGGSNNGGNNGGGNGGGNNGGGNGGGEASSTISFKWDGTTLDLKSVEVKYYSQQEGVTYLILDASGNRTQSGEQSLVELPSYHFQLLEVVGEQYGSNQQALDVQTSTVQIFSEEVMSDEDHTNMFTTPSGNNIVTLTTPDFNYVRHTKQNLSYNAETHKLSGTIDFTLSSVWDAHNNSSSVRQKHLIVTLNNYQCTQYSGGAGKKCCLK